MKPSTLAIFLALSATGCATYGPTWSEISGNRYTYKAPTINRAPALIEKVDGYSAYASYPIKLEPGQHEIVMQGITSGWPGGTELHTMTMTLEPCKRYYLNAQFDVTEHAGDRLDYVEPIAGCPWGGH
jgi:hypothetical protein